MAPLVVARKFAVLVLAGLPYTDSFPIKVVLECTSALVIL